MSIMVRLLEQWWRTGTDVVVLLILGCLALFLDLAGDKGLVVKRGFFCDDNSIRFPYKSQAAVPSWGLLLGCLLIPMVAIVLGNAYEKYYAKRTDCKRANLCGRSGVPPCAVRTGYHLRWFLIGAALTWFLTGLVKTLSGRLRPHFLAVCRPDFGTLNCTDSLGYPIYVTDFECEENDLTIVNEARRSFPSGHASLSTFTFVFLALYVASMRALYHRSALKLFAMVFFFILALMTSFSRISDNRHHPTDVVAGMVLGAGVAVTTVYYHLYYFSHYKYTARSELETGLIRQSDTLSQSESEV